MVAAWTTVQVGYDYVERPRSAGEYWETFISGRAASAPGEEHAAPHVTLWVNHLCCSGCLKAVRGALEPLDWLGTIRIADADAVMPQEQADAATPDQAAADDHDNRLQLDV